jgi:superfamily II DNA/RNA helicase
VAEALERQGFGAAWLNGDLPQGEREQVMQRTREGKLRFLVATDVAARGIDISHLTHVINFDFPESAERYVHRTGRTGRAGRTGSAVAIVTPKDIGHLYLLRLTYKIRPIEKQLPTAGELKTREETDLVQILLDAFLGTPAHPDDIALARRLLSHEAAEQIIAGLVRDHLGARPDAIEQAAAARRSKVVANVEPTAVVAAPVRPIAAAVPPRSVEGESRRPRRERPPRVAQPADDTLDVKWTVQAAEPSHGDHAFAEIFVNVGRRDGVSASDFQRVLGDVAQISHSDTGKIRIRDRTSFVSVKRDLLEKALAALNGASISGKVAEAEPARARSTGTSSPNDG